MAAHENKASRTYTGRKGITCFIYYKTNKQPLMDSINSIIYKPVIYKLI